ncbi:MAG: outer membrane protein assembly factor BamA [Holosporales bacterium]|jgi:outer membrane protein insertion porin family|nr:outer membrane protein assembly factor BamA [Holosporales bacterium]
MKEFSRRRILGLLVCSSLLAVAAGESVAREGGREKSQEKAKEKAGGGGSAQQGGEKSFGGEASGEASEKESPAGGTADVTMEEGGQTEQETLQKQELSAGQPEAPQVPEKAAKVDSTIVISDIRYVGQQRIDKETIAMYMPVKVGEECDSYTINESLKLLNKTGFFEKVDIHFEGRVLVVTVKEYPVIEKISFEGNSKINTRALKEAIKLKPNEVLSPAKIKDFQNALLENYRKLGRYNTSVNPKIINLSNGRVNLVFEIRENKTARIKRIDFIGNKKFSSRELRNVLLSKSKKWYRFFVNDDIYDSDRLVMDKRALDAFYKENGYADFKILSSVVELSANKKSFIITFTIDEGEVYKISDVGAMSLIPKIKDKDISSDLYVKKGAVYNQTYVNEDIRMIIRKATEKGFAAVSVRPMIQKDASKHTLSIMYNLAEGEKIYISKIAIKGNKRTRENVIRREVAVHEGDCLNEALVALTERNLSELGFFKRVSVSPERDPGSPNKCVVNIEVEEQSTGEAMASFSYSTATGFGIDLSYNERNFIGTGKVVSLYVGSGRARTGVGYTIDEAGNSKKMDRKSTFKFANNVSLRLAEPHLFDHDIEGSIAGFRHYLSRFYDFSATEYGGGVGASYSLTDKIQQNWEYTLARRKFNDISKTSSPIIRYQVVKRTKDNLPDGDIPGKSDTSLIKHSIGYSRFFLKGMKSYLKTSLNTTFAGLGGDAKYFSNELSGAYVISILRKTTLKFAVTGGVMNKIGSGDNPLVIDSFNKGLDSFRGFDDCGLGPRAVTTYLNPTLLSPNLLSTGVYKTSCYIGGKKFWRGTAELKFPLGFPEELQFRGFVFVDFGTVWDAPEKGEKFLKKSADGKLTACTFDKMIINHEIQDRRYIRVSPGFGISLITPVGPLVMTWAFPTRKEKYDETQKFLIGFSTSF